MNINEEIIVGVVRAYSVGRQPDSIVVVIPKELREKFGYGPGRKFFAKYDERGRIILEPLPKA